MDMYRPLLFAAGKGTSVADRVEKESSMTLKDKGSVLTVCPATMTLQIDLPSSLFTHCQCCEL